MWECPFFVNLEEDRAEGGWMLCVSPYPHHCSDRPTNPCLYWLGAFKEEQFQMDAAPGDGIATHFLSTKPSLSNDLLVSQVLELLDGGHARARPELEVWRL